MEDKSQMFNSTQKMFMGLEGDFIALGNLLYDIKSKRQFIYRGFDSFNEYIELELNTSSTFAGKLVRVYEMFIKVLDISEEDVKEIGFEKLSMVYPIFKKDKNYVKDEFVSLWMEYLDQKTISELKKLIKEYKQSLKQIDFKETVIEQGWEKACTVMNTNKKDVIYKLAITFLEYSDDELNSLGKGMREKQREFELKLHEQPIEESLDESDSGDESVGNNTST